ncbi:MAG: hypothetical protein AAF467_19795 [Actinomycetota bacterium]
MSDRLSRRRFLTGAGLTGGALMALGACSSVGGVAAPAAEAAPQLVHLFSTDHVIAAGVSQRIPFAVVAGPNLELPDEAQIAVVVRRGSEVIERTTVVGRVVNHDHVGDVDPNHQHADLLRYYALRTTLPEAGVYDLEADFGDAGTGRLPIQAFERSSVPLLLPGDPFPSLVTPTFDDDAGVDPICTLAPDPCPFHTESIDAVLADGRPMAVLVATPALCQTAYCGPVVETMIEVAPRYPSVVPTHLEFWANAGEVAGNYADPKLRLAPAVEALGLTFEPSLFLVDRQGIVVDRIDNIYDATELDASLAAIA